MIDKDRIAATEKAWSEARSRGRYLIRYSALIAFTLIPGVGMLAAILAGAMASGAARDALTGAWMAVLFLPFTAGAWLYNERQQRSADVLTESLEQQLTEAVRIAEHEADRRDLQVRRQEFESRLANALEMSDGEEEVVEVIERAFAAILPDSPAELLLADNSHAHLVRMASASPTGQAPGCGVDSPDHCPAARRAQVQQFARSEDLDACPKLRGRAEGNRSAVCVPVSIMGRTVGVIHATNEPNYQLSDGRRDSLSTLAKLAGARIGLLRTVAESQLQASTDSLTGLLNRRSFEAKVSDARRRHGDVAVAMMDLDHFKELNDTYGHETGDRALRLFAQTLRSTLRRDDVAGRHGGEEFVAVFPDTPASGAQRALDAVRANLAAASAGAGLPSFTVSCGLVCAGPLEELPAAIARADAALMQAKQEGRNRIVVHDTAGASTPSGPPAAAEPAPVVSLHADAASGGARPSRRA